MSKNPYTRLRERAEEWARSVLYPRMKVMYVYRSARLSEGWRLDNVAQRVQAADALGWDVKVTVDDDGDLRMVYVKRPDVVPFEIRP